MRWLLLLVTFGCTTAGPNLEARCSAVSGPDIEATLFHGGVCLVFHGDTKNYADAKDSCHDLGGLHGHLAFALDPQLMSHMQSELSFGYWIGLERFHQSGYSYQQGWHWVCSDKIKFEAPLSQTYWDFGDPEPDNSNCGCFMVARPGLSDITCSLLRKYVCQYNRKQQMYKEVDGGKFDVSEGVVYNGTARNQIDCGKKCSESLVCMSFSFDANSGKCVLSMRLAAFIDNPEIVGDSTKNFDKV